jgi:hypothetical protein
MSIGSFYERSDAHQKAVQLFRSACNDTSREAKRIFDEAFGFDILKVFDAWGERVVRARELIQNGNQVYKDFKELELAVIELNLKKKNNNGRLSAAEEQTLAQSDQRLQKISGALDVAKKRIATDMQQLIAGRFVMFEPIFFRLLELQQEYFSACVTAYQAYTPLIESSRKQAPKASTPGKRSETSSNDSPQSTSPRSANSTTSPRSTAAGGNSSFPFDFETPGSPAKSPAPAAPAPINVAEVDMFGDSFNFSAASTPTASNLSTQGSGSGSNGLNDMMDLFGATNSAPTTAASPKASITPVSTSANAFDMFADGFSSVSVAPLSTARSQDSSFAEADFFSMNSTSPAPSPHLVASSSMGMDPFGSAPTPVRASSANTVTNEPVFVFIQICNFTIISSRSSLPNFSLVSFFSRVQLNDMYIELARQSLVF